MLNKLYSTSMAMSTSLYQIECSGVILFALISMAKCFMHRHTCLNLPGVCEIRIYLRLQKGATNELHNQNLSIQLFFFIPWIPKLQVKLSNSLFLIFIEQINFKCMPHLHEDHSYHIPFLEQIFSSFEVIYTV